MMRMEQLEIIDYVINRGGNLLDSVLELIGGYESISQKINDNFYVLTYEEQLEVVRVIMLRGLGRVEE
ncbi:hypothetical protein [Shouchella hunanensis]|uniref:Uncharacterized protein n=1 Tax=Shouchella hunanensis TaxID=766894 RepID=A0ABY7W1T3_9BACI|nr:hypothetical protein [Shouchella hunanensis]WDF02915.1 hypothetical protein PQ477_15620 [Shouchella hunanensis]